VLPHFTGMLHVLPFFIAPPFGLRGGCDGVSRPARGRRAAGWTPSRRARRSPVRIVRRRCVHGRIVAPAAEVALKWR
jgi:hypothetical protein